MSYKAPSLPMPVSGIKKLFLVNNSDFAYLLTSLLRAPLESANAASLSCIKGRLSTQVKNVFLKKRTQYIRQMKKLNRIVHNVELI